jgi:hypothetical protein
MYIFATYQFSHNASWIVDCADGQSISLVPELIHSINSENYLWSRLGEDIQCILVAMLWFFKVNRPLSLSINLLQVYKLSLRPG